MGVIPGARYSARGYDDAARHASLPGMPRGIAACRAALTASKVPISRWWFRAKFDLAPNILIKCWNFAKLRSNFAHISQNIRKKSLKFCLCFEIFAKHSQSAHILMKSLVKFRNLLPICYQNANICKFSLNFRWLCDRRCEISIALGSKPRETVNISTKRGHIPTNFRRNKIIVKHLISRKNFLEI